MDVCWTAILIETVCFLRVAHIDLAAGMRDEDFEEMNSESATVAAVQD